MTNRKGIIVAGGTGSRLKPLTDVISKQLLPVFDKPLIYYPISCLMLAGIREMLIITTPKDEESFKYLLGDGSQLGVRFEYIVQQKAEGIAQAYILGKNFVNSNPSVLILGDNIIYGPSLKSKLIQAMKNTGATIFAYRVKDPGRYGVIDFDKQGKISGIEEKPLNPKSNFAITGLYLFDEKVCNYAKDLKFSERGELEITDLIKQYHSMDNLIVDKLSRGYAWLDTGTHESLLEAEEFVQTLEHRQGLKICCPEEIAFRNGWITENELLKLAEPLLKSGYGKYLIEILSDPFNKF